MEANNINAIATAVIAFTTTIGVLSTLIYYSVNILNLNIPIIILISILYILGVILCMNYIKVQIK